MELVPMCNKHRLELILYCKVCDSTICGDCAEEHSGAGHTVMHVSKYAATIVLPRLEKQLQDTEQNQDSSDEQHCLQELLNLLITLKEQASNYVNSVTVCIGLLAGLKRIDTPSTIRSLKEQLSKAVEAKNAKAVARLVEASKQSQSQPTQLNPFKLKTLLERHRHVNEMFKTLLDSQRELEGLVKQPSQAILHSFKCTEWEWLYLLDPATKQFRKHKMEVPAQSCGNWIATVQVQDGLYFSGGYVSSVHLKSSFELDLKPDLSIRQRRVADMKMGKTNHVLLSYDDCKLVSIGGWNGTPMNCVEVYDMIHDSWSLDVCLNHPRGWPCACIVNRLWAYCFGGYPVEPQKWIEKKELSVQDAPWSIIAVKLQEPFENECRGGRAVQIGDNAVLLFGGYYTQSQSGIYDIANNAFGQFAKLAADETSFFHSAPVVYDGNVHVIGMINLGLHVYSIKNNSWSVLQSNLWATHAT